MIEIGSDTSDKICHMVGNQFYLTNREKCHHARSFPIIPLATTADRAERFWPSGAHLKTTRRGSISSCVVSSSFACHLVFSDARNMTQPVRKATQAAESDLFKPLPPFKVCQTLIPPLKSSGNALSQKWEFRVFLGNSTLNESLPLRERT